MKHIYSGGLILGGLVVATLLWQQSPGTDRPNPFTPRPSDPALNLPRAAIDTADPSPTPTPTPTLAVLPLDPDLQAAVNTYMERLTTQGMDTNLQAVWVESSEGRSGGYQADVALPAASLTKMATTLLALERWAADYRFFTRIATTGPVVEGVLQGDLVVWGGADPFYVWESAIALGNRLNTLGISQVAGNLVIDADPIFVMNFERDRSLAGELLRQGLDARLWGWEAIQ
ncbi:MAG: D-alanyl-D-alanine carboxypeptidase, partial [Prochlorothrix sp.]